MEKEEVTEGLNPLCFLCYHYNKMIKSNDFGKNTTSIHFNTKKVAKGLLIRFLR